MIQVGICQCSRGGSRNNWWSMSAYAGNASNICNVNNNGNPNNNNAVNANGAPV